MLNLRRIERDFSRHRHEALLHEVLAQMDLGLCAGLFSGPEARAICGVALGLRRAMELSYGPQAAVAEMSQWLADEQASDGSFAGNVVATACAAAALERRVNDPGQPYDPCMGAAHERALAATEDLLARELDRLRKSDESMPLFDAAPDQPLHDVPAVLALVLLLLAEDETFALSPIRQAVIRQLEAPSHQTRGTTDACVRHLRQMARIATPHRAALAA